MSFAGSAVVEPGQGPRVADVLAADERTATDELEYGAIRTGAPWVEGVAAEARPADGAAANGAGLAAASLSGVQKACTWRASATVVAVAWNCGAVRSPGTGAA